MINSLNKNKSKTKHKTPLTIASVIIRNTFYERYLRPVQKWPQNIVKRRQKRPQYVEIVHVHKRKY